MSTTDKDGFMRDTYLQYREELCRYIVKKFGVSFSEAEDIVQSAFTRFAALESPASVDNPRAFLYTTSHNIAVDLKRHGQVQQKYTQREAGNDADSAETPGPERLFEARQRLSIISKALWGMPKRRRQLLMMSRFDGLSYAEIGRRVGLSESVVRKHVSNALADCHRALKARS